MSFLNNTTSFTRFRVIDDVPSTLWPEIPDILKKYAFKSIDELPEDRGWGWACFEDMLDTEWLEFPPQKGGEYYTFSLRLETRRVPPAVFKKYYGLRMKEELAKAKEMGKTYVAKDRKREVKDQVMMNLKKRFLPIPAEFQVVWNTSTRTVFVASTSAKVLELFEELFVLSFNLHLEQLTPYGLAASLFSETELEKLEMLEATSFRK
ncbi:hypothetical protein LJB93_00275 [Desulfovibrio sp. OttesenSCG-928-F07]|nr:hypothetical protein [Desulfovibrio sp. OttesenSCG-928-F07]